MKIKQNNYAYHIVIGKYLNEPPSPIFLNSGSHLWQPILAFFFLGTMILLHKVRILESS